MINVNQDIFAEFFNVFSKSVASTLAKHLDEDVCKKIDYQPLSYENIDNPNDCTDNGVIYFTDYVTNNKQGNGAVVIPEEFLAFVSDIMTGGEGDSAYKGKLSEIETNSFSQIMVALFSDVEAAFRHVYNETLVFGTNFNPILKETAEYSDVFSDFNLDFMVSFKLTINDKKEYIMKLFLNGQFLQAHMAELGYSSTAGSVRKTERLNMDINCLSDISINITAELGRAKVPIKYALELTNGSIVELETKNNSDIKVFANGLEFADAQIVAIGDNFGLKITKIINSEERTVSA